MTRIVTIYNIKDLKYDILVDLLRDIYCKEIPAVEIDTPSDIPGLEKLMIFFSNQYAYIVELWAVMVHHVRLLKRVDTKDKSKDAVDEAMDKRDYLEKIMSATKLKYYASSRLLRYHADQNKEG